MLVLVRTSNPGAADFEDLELADGGGAVWERVAALVDELGARGVGASRASATSAPWSARPRPGTSRGRAS